jgi:hypothetical protein
MTSDAHGGIHCNINLSKHSSLYFHFFSISFSSIISVTCILIIGFYMHVELMLFLARHLRCRLQILDSRMLSFFLKDQANVPIWSQCYPPSCTKMNMQLSHQRLNKYLFKFRVQKSNRPLWPLFLLRLLPHFPYPMGNCNKMS